jgi:SWI/SNF-related matrix-associated actin-dependent regulator 1 of chromatin subfamily A
MQNGVFVFTGSYDDKDTPKQAGFWWHSGTACDPECLPCKAGVGKVWYSLRKEVAHRLAEYADEATAAVLTEVVANIQASRALNNTSIEIPAPEGLSYLPFQKAGIAYATARPSTLIADEMGLGKTVQALGVINASPDAKRVLVVCPASLRINWQREATKWLVRPMKIHVVESNEPIPADATMVIVNYDRLKNGTFDYLMSQEWDVLIADEAHYLKSRKTKRGIAVFGSAATQRDNAVPGLRSRAKRFLALTGTPILNKPIELHPLLAAIAPQDFAFWHFAKRYCGAKETNYGWSFDGATNLSELQDKMRATCMVRRLKMDVLTDLPAKIRHVVVLPADHDGLKDAVREETAAWQKQEAAVIDARAKADAAKASGNAAAYKEAAGNLRDTVSFAFAEIARERHKLAMHKTMYVIAHVNNMIDDGAKKVILFAHHLDVIEKFKCHWGDAAVVLTGDTPIAERQLAVDRFQNDPTAYVFIGGIQAAGVGLTLTAASNVVFAELSYVPAHISQAEDRAHRIGQHDSVLVQHLVVDGSLDSRMVQTLVRKQEMADKALDIDPSLKVSVFPSKASQPSL